MEFNGVVTFSSNLTDDPLMPRPRKRCARFEDGSEPHKFDEAESYFRQSYFVAIDSAICALSERFDVNEGEKVMNSIEKVIIDAAAGTKLLDKNTEWLHHYPEIDQSRLSVQTAMFHDYMLSLNGKFDTKVKNFTQVSTICSLLTLEGTTCMQFMFSEILKLLQIYLTCPVSSATAERTFSTLRRLKTYLRSSMTQKRLNHLIIVATHKERAELVDLKSIANTFTSLNSSRLEFFGSF